MANRRLGELPPHYKFMLNPYQDERLSKCPICHKPTHARKFALFIHIDDWGPMAMGKTAKYCSPCELIMVHQHELEADLAENFRRLAPKFIGNDYLVIGTLEKKIWQQGMKGAGTELKDILKSVADFKEVYNLEVKPARWGPADEES
jgi:hypothetical protein